MKRAQLAGKAWAGGACAVAALCLACLAVPSWAQPREPATPATPSPTAPATPAGTPDPLPSGLTPEVIFSRARQVATARVAPRYVEYRVDAAYLHDGRAFSDGFQLRYRDRDAKVVGYTIPLSPEQDRKRLAGINIVIFAIPIETNPDSEPIVIRVPLLSPLSSFGLAAPRPRANPSASMGPEGEPALPEIGRVATMTREYDVAYAGRLSVGGRLTYHLTLKPVKGIRDPGSHRLRDVWVDADTFETPLLRTAGILDEKPYDRVVWTVQYERMSGNAWVIRRIWTDAQLRFGEFLDATTISDMSFAFDDFDFPANIPTALFDLAIP